MFIILDFFFNFVNTHFTRTFGILHKHHGYNVGTFLAVRSTAVKYTYFGSAIILIVRT